MLYQDIHQSLTDGLVSGSAFGCKILHHEKVMKGNLHLSRKILKVVMMIYIHTCSCIYIYMCVLYWTQASYMNVVIKLWWLHSCWKHSVTDLPEAWVRYNTHISMLFVHRSTTAVAQLHANTCTHITHLHIRALSNIEKPNNSSRYIYIYIFRMTRNKWEFSHRYKNKVCIYVIIAWYFYVLYFHY